MALISFTKSVPAVLKCYSNSPGPLKGYVRNLMSKELVYSEFGEPCQVVKFREVEVPSLGPQQVLVRMLAAPVNPADINTIQGRNYCLPSLPTCPGDEGVGEIVEIGDKVSRVKNGARVVLSSRLLGTWRYYGIYHERDVHTISPVLPLPEAAMLTIAPCTAFRMLNDFRKLNPGDTVIQNAANSPCGQSVIQFCRAWGINTYNIVSSHCGYETVKEHLLSLGANEVYTLEEAECVTCFDTSLTRPVLALDCLGGRYEDFMLQYLETNGSIVSYGCAFNLPTTKQEAFWDVNFCKFHLGDWNVYATPVEKDIMINDIIKLMVIGKFKAPQYVPVELKNFVYAFRNTADCEAFSNKNFVFDLTLP